jgi:hypothetical protein
MHDSVLAAVARRALVVALFMLAVLAPVDAGPEWQAWWAASSLLWPPLGLAILALQQRGTGRRR